MFVTFACTLFASGTETGTRFFSNPMVGITGILVVLVSFCVLLCSKHARRSVPQNYIWLLLITLGEASMVSSVAAELTMTSVLTAIMATCLTTGGLFIAAWYTSTSTNQYNLIRNLAIGVLGAVLLQLVLVLIMLFTWSFRDEKMIILSSVLMCIVVGAYIIFALLAIIIPEVTDREDYILAALRLYIEIVRLFFYLLIILGKKK